MGFRWSATGPAAARTCPAYLPEGVGIYQFTHALIQQTLFNELTTTRRVRLHARIIDVFEELAHQDGSIGWTQMANASATSYCAFLDREIAESMLGDQPGSVFAGQFAPRGSAKRDPGGFRDGLRLGSWPS